MYFSCSTSPPHCIKNAEAENPCLECFTFTVHGLRLAFYRSSRCIQYNKRDPISRPRSQVDVIWKYSAVPVSTIRLKFSHTLSTTSCPDPFNWRPPHSRLRSASTPQSISSKSSTTAQFSREALLAQAFEPSIGRISNHTFPIIFILCILTSFPSNSKT